MGLRLLREVVLLLGASALYMRLFCLYWCLFAYYVRLLCFLLRLHSMCACFAYCCVFAYYLRLFCLLVRLRHYIIRCVSTLHTCRCPRVLISQSRPSQQNNLRMDASVSLRHLPGVILTIGALDEKQALKFE